ncbi:MAG: hypothetical protein FWE21_05290 [Defluviitaleaceae bacterium]|nr:hypothetical protein [Defluviitaleaceae bacterium]
MFRIGIGMGYKTDIANALQSRDCAFAIPTAVCGREFRAMPHYHNKDGMDALEIIGDLDE